MNRIKRIKELTERLNRYRDAYYNNSISEVSDYEYDKLYDELERLENETNTTMINSPTRTIGYEVKGLLNKVRHNHPMLSLNKTKSMKDIIHFLDSMPGVFMLKLDGLTISLKYVNGDLVAAETRGDGEIGEDVLHTVKTFINVPLHIDCKEELVVDGEAIIPYDTFEKINSSLEDPKKYENPRNLASGSVRQLDSGISAKRGIKFIAWKAVSGIQDNSFVARLLKLEELGFDIVPFYAALGNLDEKGITEMIDDLKREARLHFYPIDGIVVGVNDIAYGDSMGATQHHPRSQLAYKFYGEEAETNNKRG
ncbi:MAG: hypothetical protein HFK04_07275 [Oscillospiraceae bacterium]|nr:hypothetical protein [Oscillospiraceae bacterium]